MGYEAIPTAADLAVNPECGSPGKMQPATVAMMVRSKPPLLRIGAAGSPCSSPSIDDGLIL